MTAPDQNPQPFQPATPAPPADTPDAPRPAGPDRRTRPPSNVGWAVASLVFFWPLAFAAFTHSFNVYPLWADGDVEGSTDASDRARRLGQISLWLFGALALLFVVVYSIMAVVWMSQGVDHEFVHPRMH